MRVMSVLLILGWTSLAFGFTDATLLDSFTRANEGPPPSANWSGPLAAANGLTVSTNTCRSVTTGNQDGYWNVTTFGPDTAVSASMPDATGTTGQIMKLYLRVTTPGVGTADGYSCQFYPNNPLVRIYRMDNGNDQAAQLASTASVDVNDGHKVGCEMIGSTIKAWVDLGSGWTEALSATDSTYSAAGYAGLGVSTTAMSFDDFGAMTIAAGSVSFFRRRIP
jgi:hypothetical protein